MASLQDRKVWLAGGLLAAALVAAASWLFVISPELSSASSLRSQAQNTELNNVMLQAKAAKLREQSKGIDVLSSKLSDALSALPATSDLSTFTRQVNRQATQNQVQLTSVAVGTASSATANGAATTPAANATPGQLVAIPVTLISTGSLRHQLDFLKAVQAVGPRRVLVTSTQIAPGAGAVVSSIDGSASITIQLSAFVAPQTQRQLTQLQKLLSGN
ncbi:MAG: hypothetical protein JWO57_3851 [Pseudonocardiales bacterium]|nr:hypothetical protein [Pseudonocardiales bacterium]